MEVESYLRFVFAMIFVLGLIALLAAAARRYGLGYRAPARSDKRRMSIIEVMAVDAKRRFVLMQCGDVQHLVLLGANSETLIEGGIPAPAKSLAGPLKKTNARQEKTHEETS